MKAILLQTLVTKIDNYRIELTNLEQDLQTAISKHDDEDSIMWIEDEISATERLIKVEYKNLIKACIKQGKLTEEDFDFVSNTMLDEESLAFEISKSK